jgi:hypothetical protein
MLVAVLLVSGGCGSQGAAPLAPSLTLPTNRIVYTDEALRVLEMLRTLDLRLAKTVSGLIDHLSRYAIAY